MHGSFFRDKSDSKCLMLMTEIDFLFLEYASCLFRHDDP